MEEQKERPDENAEARAAALDKRVRLYLFPPSPASRAVEMTAKAIGLDYRSIDVRNSRERPKTSPQIEHFLTYPVLEDQSKNLVLWESRSIMTYLLNTYAPTYEMYPSDPCLRAKVDMMLAFEVSAYSAVLDAVAALQLNHYQPTESYRSVEKVMSRLELELSDKAYTAGDHCTLADIALLSTLSFLQNEIHDFDFAKFPKVSAWSSRLKQELPFYIACESSVDRFRNTIKKLED